LSLLRNLRLKNLIIKLELNDHYLQQIFILMRTKFTLIICAVLFSVASFAQENTVTLKTTGSAETKEKAVQYALRSAIEQAFGAFISSNTVCNTHCAVP